MLSIVLIWRLRPASIGFPQPSPRRKTASAVPRSIGPTCTAKQKLELTRKNFFDPAAFVITGIIAGASQSQNRYPGFGQGAQGYAKRYAATYINYVTGSLLERVVMPTVLKQDPRYFYDGIGSTRSRAFYAISRAVICRAITNEISSATRASSAISRPVRLPTIIIRRSTATAPE